MHNEKHGPLQVLGQPRALSQTIQGTALYKALKRIRFSMQKGRLRRVWHWLSRGHLVGGLIAKDYLAGGGNKLQVGGGEHIIDGWLSGDLMAGDLYLDATRKLPFPDSSLLYIFTEQFFEHLAYDAGARFLREAYRVLAPGGILRQATPSLAGLIDVYLDRNRAVGQEVALQRHLTARQAPSTHVGACRFLNDYFRLWGHQFLYDRETLGAVHREAGFVNIEWKSFGESDHPLLRNLERHADAEWMKSDSVIIICEATKQ